VLDGPEHGGGWEEIWRSLESVEFFDLDAVVTYAVKLGSALTVQTSLAEAEQRKKELEIELAQLDAGERPLDIPVEQAIRNGLERLGEALDSGHATARGLLKVLVGELTLTPGTSPFRRACPSTFRTSRSRARVTSDGRRLLLPWQPLETRTTASRKPRAGHPVSWCPAPCFFRLSWSLPTVQLAYPWLRGPARDFIDHGECRVLRADSRPGQLAGRKDLYTCSRSEPTGVRAES
jgi:hypothetical protein